MGTIIAYIIIGLLGGAIAKALLPGKQGGSWLATMGLGISGALLGGFLGGVFLNITYTSIFTFKGLVFSVLGSLLILVLYGQLQRRKS